jgi:hypothetical protein
VQIQSWGFGRNYIQCAGFPKISICSTIVASIIAYAQDTRAICARITSSAGTGPYTLLKVCVENEEAAREQNKMKRFQW